MVWRPSNSCSFLDFSFLSLTTSSSRLVAFRGAGRVNGRRQFLLATCATNATKIGSNKQKDANEKYGPTTQYNGYESKVFFAAVLFAATAKFFPASSVETPATLPSCRQMPMRNGTKAERIETHGNAEQEK